VSDEKVAQRVPTLPVEELRSSSGPAAEYNKKTGFAAMDPARQREIASQGGRAVHEQGVAYHFSTEAAKAAGSKGGKALRKRK
jgi:uncharacterized protein